MSLHPPFALQNQFLLADPSLTEKTFSRSVVHITQHSTQKGAKGYILNHPTQHLVGDLFKDPEFSSLSHIPVFHGGPVAEEQLTFSAYWATKEGKLAFQAQISAHEASQFTKRPGTLLIAFIGHSGWAKGQLEEEIQSLAWILTNPTASALGSLQGIEMWKHLLSALSPYHKLLSLAPRDVSLN